MEYYHKHKGYESNKKSKSHPVSQKHADPRVQQYHNEAVQPTVKRPSYIDVPYDVPKKVEPVAAKTALAGVSVLDGFLCVNVSSINQKGLRVKFERRVGGKKRTVGVEILK